MSDISEKRMFSAGIRALIMDGYDIAFEEFLLTPAKHHVNTKHCSNDFFCEQMYFRNVVLCDESDTERRTEAEREKEEGDSSITN